RSSTRYASASIVTGAARWRNPLGTRWGPSGESDQSRLQAARRWDATPSAGPLGPDSGAGAAARKSSARQLSVRRARWNGKKWDRMGRFSKAFRPIPARVRPDRSRWIRAGVLLWANVQLLSRLVLASEALAYLQELPGHESEQF